MTIAAVQGNVPRLGLDFNAQRRAVLDNHVRVTEQLAADVAAGRRPRPDLVLWPENASDIDPLRNPDAAAAIDRAARAVGVPIVLGTVLDGPGGGHRDELRARLAARRSASSTAPTSAGCSRSGSTCRGGRSSGCSRSYADRAGNFVPGTGNGAVEAAGVRLGVAICWEIAFDDLVADSVAAGAQVLAVPSNNATFGLTDMTYQQLAMSRVRAVEHDRAVLVVTTSGVSATIAPNGTVTAATSRFAPDVLVDATPLRDHHYARRSAAGASRVGAARDGTGRGRGGDARRDDGDGREGTIMADAVGPGGPAGPVLVVIPTYNERDNLEPLLTRLHATVPDADALVVDDGSPDGTGELADKLAADDPRIRVLHRPAKAGLGAAYLAGFATALAGEHRVVVEMDADGSHAPEDLPALLAALTAGSARTWCSARATSGAARSSTGPHTATGSPAAATCTPGWRWASRIRDITGGYRVFRREVLESLPLDQVESQGYCFQVDLAWRALQAGFRVVEVPITFTERERGASKMSNGIVAEAFWKVTQWGVARRWDQLRRRPTAVGTRYARRTRTRRTWTRRRGRIRADPAPPWTGAGVRRSRRAARRAAPAAR